ncbi:MAG TPA: histidine kinase dimerization/phospho-acceptor domain-containing protein [Thermoanaerobaculia bacterium]|nr:histidine kinase dimerization/phospho-acceptor domain-containing protein [Thermoanaerobaculia bacterium]
MERWQEKFAESMFRRSADINHDLKTPLNIAVLNLELLRMRLRKLAAEAAEDEKVGGYLQSIELELRRLGRVFDAVFQLAMPAGTEGPGVMDLVEDARKRFDPIDGESGPALIHEDRLRDLLDLIAAGATKIFRTPPRVSVETTTDRTVLRLEAEAEDPDLELGKLFKFYYTDSSGNPEISLATARLIAENYGGELTARLDEGSLILELTVPPGDHQ